MWWLILLPVALVLGYFLLTGMLGNKVKPETTGFYFLKREFKKNGVPFDLYGEECIRELVAGAIRVGKMRNSYQSNMPFNIAFVEQLNAVALIAASHYNGQLNKFDMDSSIVKCLQQAYPVKQSFEV
ncbi:MAG: hypothetical protein IOC64_07955 [Methylobacterium sp.]|nr:hypothetical protein [Methylobacterium sp.]MCA3599592.1 hypothetical protein [Methylobacterium sp.]MCA3606409.1 hypothetical protein [Methylobacterium sp.]MCA3610377.1 hypothetical protein [Methylobacterium sp.]MCA3617733.1 hypothetical protein [Methylobacterium sp.]